jgi:hypothetical protein
MPPCTSLMCSCSWSMNACSPGWSSASDLLARRSASHTWRFKQRQSGPQTRALTAHGPAPHSLETCTLCIHSLRLSGLLRKTDGPKGPCNAGQTLKPSATEDGVTSVPGPVTNHSVTEPIARRPGRPSWQTSDPQRDPSDQSSWATKAASALAATNCALLRRSALQSWSCQRICNLPRHASAERKYQ